MIAVWLFLSVGCGLYGDENAAFQVRLVVGEDTPGATVYTLKRHGYNDRPHPNGDTYRLGAAVFLDETDIDEVNGDRQPQTGQWRILIDFNAAGAVKLREFTGTHIGEKAAILINGELVMVAVIQEEVAGGKLQVAGDFDREEVRDFASWFRKKHGVGKDGRGLFH